MTSLNTVRMWPPTCDYELNALRKSVLPLLQLLRVVLHARGLTNEGRFTPSVYSPGKNFNRCYTGSKINFFFMSYTTDVATLSNNLVILFSSLEHVDVNDVSIISLER